MKWFVPEEEADSARKLKREYEQGKNDILSPQLILFEVANALRYHPVVRMSEVDLATAIEALRDMAITVEMYREVWVETFELSRTEEISIYDAVYLGLAELSQARFVTADHKLRDGLSDTLKQNVLLISDLE